MENFLSAIKQHLSDDSFVKLTFSKPIGEVEELKNVYARPVLVKGQQQISFTYHYKTRDVVKNHDYESSLALVESLLNKTFRAATLLTTQEQIIFEISKKGKQSLRRSVKGAGSSIDRSHDKEKKTLVNVEAPYLKHLGLTDDKKRIIPRMSDKFRQINKYLEIVDGLIKGQSWEGSLDIVDMGSGKGYLTFALYDHLVNGLGLEARIVGVEQRSDLVDSCNAIAEKCKYTNLQFARNTIENYQADKLDILIALHACDTATDDAIAKGIGSKADLIICAPCCHKQIRQQVKGREQESPLLKYGIFKEREFEMVTDTLRALMLEQKGYRANIFEFISNEHTRKNTMLVGAKQPGNVNGDEATKKIEMLKKEYQIDFHYLEKLIS
ncbi:MAG: SAM-dependent methyltransferase [Cyclobacteriaceae bacterium]